MANGTLKVQNIETSSGSGTITLGQSGETVIFGSGVTTKFNQPAFFADLSADQTAPATFVAGKVNIDNEIFDTDNCYDPTTNYRFTPTVAGKYFVYGTVSCDTSGNGRLEGGSALIYKNGSKILGSDLNLQNNPGRFVTMLVHGTVDMNGSTDYLELYGLIGYNAGTPVFDGANKRTSFGAYRMGVE